MSAIGTLQRRLFDCCQDQRDENNDDLLSLNHILIEINRQNKQYLIDAEDETYRAPLFHAIENGKSLYFLQQLLGFPARITTRILICAIRYGNLNVLQLLHQYGADFKQSYHGLSLLHECILLHKNDLIPFLIEAGGISPDAIDYDNQTPLLYAIFRTNIEAILTLLHYSSIDPCSISTHKQHLTCFHVACELDIDEVILPMIKHISKLTINNLSKNDQTPFDLFLSCYLYTKNNLFMNEISLQKFSSLFDLFIFNGGKLHHLTRAYRRTRASYVTKILTIIFKKQLSFSDIILQTNRSTILLDLQSLTCQSLGDWPYLVQSNDGITSKQCQLILRQLYELFTFVYYKSINAQIIDRKLLRRYCLANEKDSTMKQILWSFIKNFIEPTKAVERLKSMCRRKILLNLKSIDKHCISSDLGISNNLENYLLFFTRY